MLMHQVVDFLLMDYWHELDHSGVLTANATNLMIRLVIHSQYSR